MLVLVFSQLVGPKENSDDQGILELSEHSEISLDQLQCHSYTLQCFLFNQIQRGQFGAVSELAQVQIRL